MALFWISLTILGCFAALALVVFQLWGPVAAELERSERRVYGESLSVLAQVRQEKPVGASFRPRVKISLVANVAKR